MAMRILAMIMAGGKGERLMPLTAVRAKPAVMFGGKYRIIDFVLNNFVNSGIHKIKVLTQFKSDSLIKHLHDTWYLNRSLGEYIDPVPAQMRRDEHWYQGTADAIHQNLNIIEDEKPSLVCVFGGDHVYKMDIMQMVYFHLARGADVSISTIPVPVEQAHRFGVLRVGRQDRVSGFQEKPEHPWEMQDRPGYVLASMGNYIFSTPVLCDLVSEDASAHGGQHDFGKNILPAAIHTHKVFAYNFMENKVPGANPEERGYWRDVGSLESYFDANMDLRSVSPVFNLYSEEWPLRSGSVNAPPAKFVFGSEGGDRRGMAVDSLVSEGCIISGGVVVKSILSPSVFVHSYAEVLDSIILSGVDIGRGTKIRRAIIDKYVQIPDNERIGYDLEQDRQRYFVSEGGIVVIAKHTKMEDRHLQAAMEREL